MKQLSPFLALRGCLHKSCNLIGLNPQHACLNWRCDLTVITALLLGEQNSLLAALTNTTEDRLVHT